MDDSDKRKFKRIKRGFIFRFRPLSDDLWERVSSGWDMGSLENISAGGILFKYSKELRLDLLLDFSLKFPVVKFPICGIGKIVRVEEIPDSNIFLIAMNFVEIKESEKKTIDEFTEKYFNKDKHPDS